MNISKHFDKFDTIFGFFVQTSNQSGKSQGIIMKVKPIFSQRTSQMIKPIELKTKEFTTEKEMLMKNDSVMGV